MFLSLRRGIMYIAQRLKERDAALRAAMSNPGSPNSPNVKRSPPSCLSFFASAGAPSSGAFDPANSAIDRQIANGVTRTPGVNNAPLGVVGTRPSTAGGGGSRR